MKDALISEMVTFLTSENPGEKHIHLYLNDSNLRKQCDEMISKILNEKIINRNYDISPFINFLNNVTSKQLRDKPYMLEFNIIKKTINERLMETNAKRIMYDEEGVGQLTYDEYKISGMLMDVERKFALNHEIDSLSESKMTQEYIQKMKENKVLSYEETQELMYFTLSGGFNQLDEKLELYNTSMDYVLKNVMEQDYSLDKHLKRELFNHYYGIFLDERGIRRSRLSLEFVKDLTKKRKALAQYSHSESKILYDADEFEKGNFIKALITVFHEIRHYEQYNSKEENLSLLLQAKDSIMQNAHKKGDKYYQKNYFNISYEKDAIYNSYEEMLKFISEKVPSQIPKAKKSIYKGMEKLSRLQNKNIFERKSLAGKKDVNVMFEKYIQSRDGKENYRLYMIKYINSPLLVEYSVQGKKRSILELLEEKERVHDKGRAEIIDYLLYEESTSFKYITENMSLLERNKNNINPEYYEEAKKILKKKTVQYYANALADVDYKLASSGFHKKNVGIFFNKLVNDMRKANVEGLNRNGDIKLYQTREEELRATHKLLSELLEEKEELGKSK